MRASVDDIIDEFDIDDNSWGFNLGGGVMGMFTDNVGIRGDLRYFRSFRTDVRDDIGDLDFDLERPELLARVGGRDVPLRQLSGSNKFEWVRSSNPLDLLDPENFLPRIPTSFQCD